MQSFMKHLVQQRDKLSQLEKQVLNFFIRYPEKIDSLKLEDAAKEMYVSTATISRTCKKLGFQGFQDFKLQLKLYRHDVDDSKHHEPSASLSSHIRRYEQDIHEALKRIDENLLKQAKSMIKRANQIEWFGVGHSYSVCLDASKKLIMLGKRSMARTDWDDLRYAALNLTKDDLAIFVSNSGETLNILEYAHLVKKQGTPILSLVGTKHNRLSELSDFVFYTPIKNYYHGEIDMCSRAPFNIFLDLLLLEYGS